IEQELRTLLDCRSQFEHESGLLRKADKEAMDIYEASRHRLSTLDREVSEVTQSAVRLNEELGRVNGRPNTYAEEAGKSDATLRTIRILKEEAERTMALKLAEFEAVSFWVGGFRDLRLWLVDRSLSELEIAVNNSLYQLGLVGWGIDFAVEREIKGGGLSRGFEVLVSSPLSQAPVPWNSWSGGELQRLRIAGAIGFGDLILSRRGVVGSNVEVWDEPTAHLSEAGIRDLLGLLEARALSERKTIFVIDHHSLEYPFAGTLQVIKRDGHSRLVWDRVIK
ncbi:MAG: hypothetical protein V3T30_04455, partial [Thermodesulfobacteriota bacterium]